jgi:hypothetical protein
MTEGHRTPDIAALCTRTVGTAEIGDLIVETF